ncbi:aminotransferase class I/II-fold pyridoxal phosphate-dependent enzyme [Streptomyces aidingensis]|uniref:DNA-binding transcriptional regulator, MocR family, contains an aminotransferase domain n=1 Tax=Streptomyces aidingensis TaxID=910347 RepID=A0A1I1PH41_9ACTN|nr:aminotransferase class I/II-fold pyridoxal phosphate-dependent enzyme [Streptomyces aidingensis]SFD08966.1 DNA-binding transcriptional regulator, MocR family, contains an aminotransferase domain [Streptomyces aidingensis]
MTGDYRITGRRAVDIAAGVERAVGEGRIAPGESLPPLRALAGELAVNPNTVAAAYRLLRDRGVIETAGRRGSRVRRRPASTAREAIRPAVPEGVRDLSQGNPDPALLPPLGEALAAVAARYDRGPLLYGMPETDDELAAAARESFAADGVAPGPVAVTSGSLDAIERVLAAHLRPGDTVAVEDPGWGSLLDLVPALGLRAHPVALDDDGPLPEAVAGALRGGARALVVTARAQNPTGAAVSAGRAGELRTVLAGHPGTLLIEDDHGHGIVDVALHTLAGATGHWAAVRSAAKWLGPDLRVAVLTGDAVTVDRVRGRQRLGPGWVSHLLQRTTAALWRRGAAGGGARAAARSYSARRGALLAGLAALGVPARGHSGMNVWVPVADETGAVTRLLGSGWAAAPGARFRVASPPGIRLTISPLSPEEIPGVAAAVAEAVRPPAGRRYA